MKFDVVVTKHESLIQVMKEQGYDVADAKLIKGNASVEDIEGKHVIGVLPLHLAAHTASVTVPTINTPVELRTQELSYEQLKEFLTGFETYQVNKVS